MIIVSWLTDSNVQYNDNCFLANGQWEGHNSISHVQCIVVCTIKKCFRKAGVLRNDFEVQVVSEEEDPFADIDDTVQLGSLIHRAMGGSSCSAEEYITGEDALPVCADFDCEDWEENWLNSLNDNPDSDTGDNSDSDTGDTKEVDYDRLPPPPKLNVLSKLLKLWKMYKYSWSTEATLSKQPL